MFKNKSNQQAINGQAIVEYLLILSVLVVIGGGILFQFNKGVEAYGKALFGQDGQIPCLLRTGLLPHQASSSDCNTKQDAINEFQKAVQTAKNNNKGGKTNTSNNNSNKAKNTNQANTQSTKNTSSNNSYNSNKANKSFNKSNRHTTGGSLIAMNNTNTPDLLKKPSSKGRIYKSSRGKRKKKSKNKFSSSAGSGFKGYGQNSSGVLYDRLDFSGQFEEDEIDNLRPALITTSATHHKNQTKAKNKPMLLAKNLKKKSQIKDDEGGWSFGNSFRIILIIAVIAIIAFIIFTQVNSIRQSLK